MRSTKNSRLITVREAHYRWRATGNDGYISVSVWPLNNVGPFISGNFEYHQTFVDKGGGVRTALKDQLVVTGKLVRRIIEHAINVHGYDPDKKGKQLNLRALEKVIKWDDAIRASKP